MHPDRTRPARSILMVALGNPMAGDDGFGQRVAARLQDLHPPTLRIVDLSREGPAGLLDHLGNEAGLILVDAVTAPGRSPGEIVDVDWASDARPALVHEPALSTHGLSIARQLDLAAGLGLLPGPVRLVGAVLGSTRCGEGLSAPLVPAVSSVVEAVLRRAEIWEGRAGL